MHQIIIIINLNHIMIQKYIYAVRDGDGYGLCPPTD